MNWEHWVQLKTIHIITALLGTSLIILPANTYAATTTAAATNANSVSQQTAQALTQLELNLLGRQYIQDNAEQRIGRMEKFIFGETKGAYPIDRRIQALAQYIIPPKLEAPKQPQESISNTPALQQDQTWTDGDASSDDEFTDEEDAVPQGPPTAEVIQSISAVESRLFGRNFPQESPDLRLNRLEMTLFNSTAPEMTYEDRAYRAMSVVESQTLTRQEDLGGSPAISNNGSIQGSYGFNPQTGQFNSLQGGYKPKPIAGYGKNGPQKVKTPSNGGFGGGGFGLPLGGMSIPLGGGGIISGSGSNMNSLMWMMLRMMMR